MNLRGTITNEQFLSGVIQAAPVQLDKPINYEKLQSKPKINGVELSGNLSLDSLGINRSISEALSDAAQSGAFQGTPGVTPKLSIGTVETLDAGMDAHAVITGTPEFPVLNLHIPKGAPGLPGGSQTPLFANSVEECTDTSKVYVLPDGQIWAFMQKEEYLEPYKNLFNKAAEGYKEGYRFSSSGGEAAEDGAAITNYIPIKIGQALHIKGIATSVNGGSSYLRIEIADESKTRIGSIQCPTNCTQEFLTAEYDGTVAVYHNFGYRNGSLPDAYTGYIGANLYIRIGGTLAAASDNLIITVDENIQGEPGYVTAEGWADTGHAFVPGDYEDRIIDLEVASAAAEKKMTEMQTSIDGILSPSGGALPDYWEAYLSEKTAAIHALQDLCGKDCFTFINIADIHRTSNLGKLSPQIAARIAQECCVKYVLVTGDTQTRGCWPSKDKLLEEEAAFREMIKPVDSKMLRMEGNHDRSYGTLDRDGDGSISNSFSDGIVKPAAERETYVYSLTEGEAHRLFYRPVGMVGDVHFDSTGTAYYVDDTTNKVRYICLNTHCVPYEENQDGTAKYSPMWVYRYTQSQFDFLVGEALTTGMDDNWSVVVAGHVPPTQEIGDREIMLGVLSAYKDKTTYSGEYAGVYGFDAVSVNADFTDAKGNFVAYFHGHNHEDSVQTAEGLTIIGTRCDGAQENDPALLAQRIAGTVTEQSFDVFTVDTANGVIYATKIGAGEDRIITL